MPKEPISLADHRVKYWKGVIYAPPGVGKTVLASASQQFRTFVFDTDDGMSSARAWLVRNKLRDDMVKFWPVKTHQDFMDGCNWLTRNIKDFELVVIDSATELARLVKVETAKKAGHDSPDQQDWGRVLDAMELIITMFKGGQFHMLFLCHEMVRDDKLTGVEQYRPSFQGAFKTEYAKHFSFIARYQLWWANVKGQDGKQAQVLQRWLNFGPDPAVHYKDRSGVMARWEKPDIDYILNKMIASQGEDSASVSQAAAIGSELQAVEQQNQAIATNETEG